jgi:hypothetical protein
MKQRVCTQGERNTREHPCEQRDDASTNTPPGALFGDSRLANRLFAHDLAAPFPKPAAPDDSTSCARRS